MAVDYLVHNRAEHHLKLQSLMELLAPADPLRAKYQEIAKHVLLEEGEDAVLQGALSSRVGSARAIGTKDAGNLAQEGLADLKAKIFEFQKDLKARKGDFKELVSKELVDASETLEAQAVLAETGALAGAGSTPGAALIKLKSGQDLHAGDWIGTGKLQFNGRTYDFTKAPGSDELVKEVQGFRKAIGEWQADRFTKLNTHLEELGTGLGKRLEFVEGLQKEILAKTGARTKGKMINAVESTITRGSEEAATKTAEHTTPPPAGSGFRKAGLMALGGLGGYMIANAMSGDDEEGITLKKGAGTGIGVGIGYLINEVWQGGMSSGAAAAKQFPELVSTVARATHI